MSFKGQLSEYPLPQLFQVLEQDKKTGVLAIHIFTPIAKTFEKKQIFFDQGQVVAASDLSGKDLLCLIQEQGFVNRKSFSSLAKLIDRSNLKMPIGEYLQLQNMLNIAQIEFLFEMQVIEPVCKLYSLENAWFSFTESENAPYRELTGQRISPKELIFKGLHSSQKLTDFKT